MGTEQQQSWKRETQNSMQTAQRAKEPPSGLSNDFYLAAYRAEEGYREGSPQDRMAKAEWGILKDGDKLSGPSAGLQCHKSVLLLPSNLRMAPRVLVTYHMHKSIPSVVASTVTVLRLRNSTLLQLSERHKKEGGLAESDQLISTLDGGSRKHEKEHKIGNILSVTKEQDGT